jgi:cystathionine beta-lyase/cystathionine gamma-synthase
MITDVGEHGGQRRFDTLAVHAGEEPDELTGSVTTPIYQTSTYAQDGVGRPRRGYEYARTQNPTRERLEHAVATLEGARHGIAFASGSACTAALVELLRPGDRVIVGDDVYGGTFRYLDKVARSRGIESTFADLAGDLDVLDRAFDARTRMVWFESPTNPHLKIVDIEAVATASHRHTGDDGRVPVVVVDNTFASPALQRPLELGADVVFHSATKYLGGHSDTVNGVVVTSSDEIADQLRFLQNAMGAVPGPMDCFLVLRGIRTLSLRMERHSANALKVATFLSGRDDVEWVLYPGLTSGPDAHPRADLAARQMKAAGGMISFAPCAGGRHDRAAAERAAALCEGTHIIHLAESLGGVESLIEVPAAMTHMSVKGSPLEVEDALIRLSVGIEDPDDLIEDLRQALDGA